MLLIPQKWKLAGIKKRERSKGYEQKGVATARGEATQKHGKRG
jgi:hypothetical protein